MTDKTVIVTGITGQDNAYLAELLHRKSYTKRDLSWAAKTSLGDQRINVIIDDRSRTLPIAAGARVTRERLM